MDAAGLASQVDPSRDGYRLSASATLEPIPYAGFRSDKADVRN